MRPMHMNPTCMPRWRAAGALLLVLALSACTLGPEGTPPAIDMPARYGVQDTPGQAADAQGVAQRFAAGAAPVPRWWTRYRSAALDALVDEGLASSPDLAAAERRLASAREQLRAKIGESLLPAVDAGASAARQRALTMPNLPSPTALYNVFTGQVQARYTFDLFGAARYANAALAARVDRQAMQIEAARRALAANIVASAIDASSLREQLRLAERQADLAEQVARDAQRRFELGAASQAEALDARRSADDLRAGLPGLRAQWQAARHALAVLLGRTPDQAPPDLDFASLSVPAEVPVVVPSELLASRPDVRAAELALRAAAAELGLATAQMLPSLSISAGMGRGGFSWPDALSGAGSIWSAGLSLTQPIFHGGALRAQRRAALEDYEAAADDYRQTVLTAFRNVADSLARLEADGAALASAQAASEAAARLHADTVRRVRLGALAETSARASEQRYIEAQRRALQYASARLSDTALLFQAMGSPNAAAGAQQNGAQ